MTRRHLSRAVRLLAWGLALGGVTALGACGTAAPVGATATWESVGQTITPEQTRLSVAVTRLGCASGKTGTVLEPLVTYEETRIVIRTTVAPLPKNVGYDCQGNDAVQVDIALAEPIGQRALVDAACLQDDGSRTATCVDGGVRWKPASG